MGEEKKRLYRKIEGVDFRVETLCACGQGRQGMMVNWVGRWSE